MPVTASARAWIAVAAAWLSYVAGLLTWLSRTPAGALREELKSLQFWSLEICVLLGLLLGSIILRDLLHGLERSDRRRMVMLAALSISLTVFVAPRTNRIYYDEQIYQSVGQNLSDLRLAQVCHDGNVEYRPAAVLEWGVQQTAVCLSAPVESGVSLVWCSRPRRRLWSTQQ